MRQKCPPRMCYTVFGESTYLPYVRWDTRNSDSVGTCESESFSELFSRCWSCLCNFTGGCFLQRRRSLNLAICHHRQMYRSDGMALIRWASETIPSGDFATTLGESLSDRQPSRGGVPFGFTAIIHWASEVGS